MPAALYRHALTLISTGQCATAMAYLNRSIIIGHLLSRALMTWMLLDCRYGQYVLDRQYRYGALSVTQDGAKALALYQLAAAQNFDEAQYGLGLMYYQGYSVAKDYAEALRLFQLAAAQGHPQALFQVAECHERGRGGVPKNVAEAIRWYRRAQAAGYCYAAEKLQRLCAE